MDPRDEGRANLSRRENKLGREDYFNSKVGGMMIYTVGN